jgi:uncharacterized lipoprotein YajG
LLGPFRRPLLLAALLAGCAAPATPTVSVRPAAGEPAPIRDGHAIGVTVKTTPSNEAIARCIAEAVQDLHFRVDHRLDVTFTTFAAD